jgi:hypothetical protein
LRLEASPATAVLRLAPGLEQEVAMIGPKPPDSRKLLKKLLRKERSLLAYRPTVRDTGPPPEPHGADEVLALLSACYPPGTALGLAQIMEATGATCDLARSTRLWAKAVGAWPYLLPGPCRPAGETDPGPSGRRRRERRGGGS